MVRKIHTSVTFVESASNQRMAEKNTQRSTRLLFSNIVITQHVKYISKLQKKNRPNNNFISQKAEKNQQQNNKQQDNITDDDINLSRSSKQVVIWWFSYMLTLYQKNLQRYSVCYLHTKALQAYISYDIKTEHLNISQYFQECPSPDRMSINSTDSSDAPIADPKGKANIHISNHTIHIQYFR